MLRPVFASGCNCLKHEPCLPSRPTLPSIAPPLLPLPLPPTRQVPRFWLIGYDENRQPLTNEQVGSRGRRGSGGVSRECRTVAAWLGVVAGGGIGQAAGDSAQGKR